MVNRQKPTLESAISSLLLYEKEESLEYYHLLLSPVYLDTMERLDVLKEKEVRAVHVAFFYDEVDTKTTPHSSHFTIRGMPLRDMEFQQEHFSLIPLMCRIRSWLRLSYQHHTIAIQLPPLFSQVHAAEVGIWIEYKADFHSNYPQLPHGKAISPHYQCLLLSQGNGAVTACSDRTAIRNRARTPPSHLAMSMHSKRTVLVSSYALLGIDDLVHYSLLR